MKTHSIKNIAQTILGVLLCVSCGHSNKTIETVFIADVVLTHVHVWESNAAQSTADMIAIKEDKITFVGARKDGERYIDETTKVFKLNGETVVFGAQSTPGQLITSADELRVKNKIRAVEEGENANLLILNKDPLVTQNKDSKNIQVIATVSGGQYTYLGMSKGALAARERFLFRKSVNENSYGCGESCSKEHDHGRNRFNSTTLSDLYKWISSENKFVGSSKRISE